MNKGNSDSRFKLDGRIESPKESMYLIDQLRLKSKRQKLIISSLIALLVVSAAALAGLFYQLQSIRAELDDARLRTSTAEAQSQKFDSLNQVISNFFEENLRLQADNDLLVENSDRLEGIFFEILLGGFEDFNLERYLESIAVLKKQKYDGSDKLVIGRFRSFKKALLFENDLKRTGLKNVVIVGRVDGEVVSFKEALEAAQRENN